MMTVYVEEMVGSYWEDLLNVLPVAVQERARADDEYMQALHDAEEEVLNELLEVAVADEIEARTGERPRVRAVPASAVSSHVRANPADASLAMDDPEDWDVLRDSVWDRLSLETVVEYADRTYERDRRPMSPSG